MQLTLFGKNGFLMKPIFSYGSQWSLFKLVVHGSTFYFGDLGL